MSNALAIAAVTATLQSIVGRGVRADPDLNDTTVTTLPLDKARDKNTANQVNVFLYHVLPNASWANMDLPRQVMPGETGMPPLALKLYYLVTAYGRDNDVTQPFSHLVLGSAMSVLHDFPVLSAEEIQAATSASLPRNDLDRQIERVRITLQPLSLEEISKLWTGFQTQYRTSVSYEATVVLIESNRATKAAVPVLTRGPGDQGVTSQGDLIPPYPSLREAIPPKQQPSFRLGDTLILNGHHLDGTNIRVRFSNPNWAVPVEVVPDAGGTGQTLSVTVPNQPALWPAGFYTVAVLVQRPGESYRRVTNELSLSLAPSFSISPTAAAAGDISFTVTCGPEVRPAQRVVLLLGDGEIPVQAFAAQTGTLTFLAKAVAAGDYWVRLRVDGVDSLLVADRSASPPVFDPTAKVKIT